MHRSSSAIVLLSALALLPGAAFAHDFTLTDTRVLIRSGRTFEVEMTCNLDALALGVSPAADPAELAGRLRALPAPEREKLADDLRSLFQRRVRVRFDGKPQEFSVSFPGPAAGASAAPGDLHVLGVIARLGGSIPEGATSFTFWASRSFQAVRLRVESDVGLTAPPEIVGAGDESRPYVLRDLLSLPPAGATFWRYLVLGFHHILPEGVDHVLFVLGLFLLGTRLSALLWQVTAFTLAHCITLALAVQGVVALPSRVVEPLIALSIAYIAIENILTRELKPWRPMVVFAFGLLHGLGFASVLMETGLPGGRLALSLAAFNAGVELGQIAVIGIAFLAVGLFRKRRWYRRGIVVPASAAIGLVGLYWTIERAFF